MFQAVLNEQMQHPHVVNTLEKGVLGGSIATAALMKRIVNELGIKYMVNEYGMTEASGVITMTKYEEKFERQVSSVGIPLPNTEIKLINQRLLSHERVLEQ
jgi:fatty-acyl-CoA synthase